jgi:arylformamidase
MSKASLVFGTYAQAGLDAQYDNRVRVPDHPEIFRRWREASRRARERLQGRLGLAYGPGERERLDVFPAPMPGAPTLLFLHGGYWQAMDRADFTYLAPAWVEAGVTVVIASYPLAPVAGMDEIVAAAGRAAAWAEAHRADWQGGPGRLYAAGHSAGGQLVAMLLAGAAPLLKGGIGLSGLYDLEPIRLSYLNKALGLDRHAARRNSPLAVGAGAGGALLLAVGGAESQEFLRQTEAMARHWRSQGETVDQVDLPGRDHFSALDALAEPAHPLFQAARRLVTSAGRGM